MIRSGPGKGWIARQQVLITGSITSSGSDVDRKIRSQAGQIVSIVEGSQVGRNTFNFPPLTANGMETWKLLLGLAGVLIAFSILATAANVSLSSPWVIGLFVLAIVVSVLFYVVSRYGYQLGRQIGESMKEDE